MDTNRNPCFSGFNAARERQEPAMDTPSSFGGWLRRRRKAFDLTQAELARRVGCSPITIRKMEADELRPSKQMAQRLAQELHVAPEDHAAFVAFARDAGGVEPPALPARAFRAWPHSETHPTLPAQVTPLLGRDEEVAEIRHVLLHSDVRIVTLIGPGGIGKTRLGLEVAASLLDEFEDGVYFVDLASVDDPSRLASQVAQSLGVREQADRSVLETLRDWLHGKQMLLLLDNFEQVSAAAPLVGQLAATAPGLKVLATSRSPLHVRGEQEFAVPPLAIPPPHLSTPRADDASRLMQYAAVQLFVDRAQAVKRDFAVTNENARAVADICVRLDGLPLAIELAAARVRLLSPEAMLGRLEQWLPFLVGGPRDAPTRQQTLRGTIDWSYNLLPAAEKILFRRLGVFLSGFSLEAAEAVCGVTSDPRSNVLDGVEALVAKSLLRPEEGGSEGPCFIMLETLREYAAEQLTISGEADGLRDRHARYFLGRAQEVASYYPIGRPEQRSSVQRLDREYDDLRAALRYFQETGEAPMLLRLANALCDYQLVVGRYSEGRAWLQRALALAGTDQITREHAQALTGQAMLSQFLGDYPEARSAHEKGSVAWRQVGDTLGLASTLMSLGRVEWILGDYEAARSHELESLDLFEELGDPVGAAYARRGLGLVMLGLGDVGAALAVLEQNVETHRALPDEHGLAYALLAVGRALILAGNPAGAQDHLEESLGLFRRIHHQRGLWLSLHKLGYAARHLGNIERAQSLHLEALRIVREIQDANGRSSCLVGLAGVAAAWGEWGQAARLLAVVERARHALGAPLTPTDRVEYEQMKTATRDHLAASQLAVAWEEGRAMTLEQAVAYALEGRTR